MSEAAYFIGIDVAKRKLDIALLYKGKVKSKVVENSPAGYTVLLQLLAQHGASADKSHACMEATGPYSEAVALALTDAGWTLSVVNPARIKGFAQGELARNKTDRADAALLARFCLAMHPSVWIPPSQEWRQLRAWVNRLQALKDMRQQEVSRIEANQAAKQPEVVKAIQAHVDWLDQQIKQLESDIDDHINRHPQLKQDAQLLLSIPGIGATTVAKLLAYAGDIKRFTNAKALAAFIGVTPRHKLSGSSVKGRTMMSRTGHADLRKALYMPGMVRLRHNPVIREFGTRLRAKGMAPKAVVGAAMRKLAHVIYGVVSSGMPFDAKLAGMTVDFQDGI
jgi:transposase